MKNKNIIKSIMFVLLALLIFSCKENKPRGDEFHWSPDGTKLVMINLESRELLLVEVENNKIQNIELIDSYKDHKKRILSHGWAPDGNYILYSKVVEKHLDTFIYSIAEKSSICIGQLSGDIKEKSYEIRSNPVWLQNENLVIFPEKLKNNEMRLVMLTPEGLKKKISHSLKTREMQIQLSPGEDWIAYSIDKQINSPANDLWRIKKDGSGKQKLYSGKTISEFNWSPDGKYIALIESETTQKDTLTKLVLLDIKKAKSLILIGGNTNKKNEPLAEDAEISDITWTKSSGKIMFLSSSGDKKNIWSIDIATGQSVKLTFDNVAGFFGLSETGELFFTIKYPEMLVELTSTEKDKMEFSEFIRGTKNKNILMRLGEDQLTKIGKNVFAYKNNPVTNGAAYFKIFEPKILEQEIYLPVIQLSDGEIEYIARTQKERISAVDAYVRDQQYQKALKHLSDYWDTDFYAADFSDTFSASQFNFEYGADSDSCECKKIVDGLKDGALTKTMFVLRELGENEKADWLFEQYLIVVSELIKDSENNFDEFFWNIIAAFGKYNEFENGIKELDQINTAVQGDSLFRSYLLLSQSLLALEDEQLDLSLNKMKASVQLIPAKEDELEPYNFILSFIVNKSTKNYTRQAIEILELMTSRLPHAKDAADSYEILGDLYSQSGNKDQAKKAYQMVVQKQNNNSKIWDKIIELEMN